MHRVSIALLLIGLVLSPVGAHGQEAGISPATLRGEIRSGDTVPLRDYIETRLSAIEQATRLAREGMEKRLDGMNEFRATLDDQAKSVPTRLEFTAKLEKYESEAQALRADISKLAPIAELQAIRVDVQSLRESRAEISGKATQVQMMWAMGIAIASFVIAGARFILTYKGTVKE